jgi:hypothetical protein
MEVEEFIARHPRLFHMAEAGAWASVREHGLLSTSALLDLFEYDGSERKAIESEHRSQIVQIIHPRTGATAMIRDNKPLRSQFLAACLEGMSMRQWYELLNRKVFFWVSEARLEGLLKARAYKNRPHEVITIDTAALLARGTHGVTLAPINTGATLYPSAPPRGRDTFKAIDEYPLTKYVRWRGQANAIVELAVDYEVPAVEEVALSVWLQQAGSPRRTLWRAQ